MLNNQPAEIKVDTSIANEALQLASAQGATPITVRSELHERLRTATKGPHHLLDHHPLLAPLIRPGLTVTQYGSALCALHGVFALAESQIDKFLIEHQELFDYAARRKLPALDADLNELGRKPVALVADLPALNTLGALIGFLYTVEGTTQGGQAILRIIRQNPNTDLPMRFFTGYGEQSKNRWDEFLQFADKCCPKAEYEIATATATSLFVAIKDHLDISHGQISADYLLN